MNIIKLIKEVISAFNEDVGEKYLKRKYGMSGDFDDFEKKYISYSGRQKQIEIIHSDGDWKLFKNPPSINDVGENARGVILSNGDLYIESYGGEKIHNDILEILANKNILPVRPKKNWTRKLPQESGFLTVQRYKNSPYIAIGESNKLLYDENDYNKYINDYKTFINKAKSKNPGLNFIDKLVGTKYLQSSTPTNVMNESYLK